MSEHSSLIRSVVMAGAATLLGIHSPAADAALFAYDRLTVGAGPSVYLAGDEDAGTNVLNGQNPAIGPTAIYGGAWVQAGGDAQAVKDIGSLAYPLFPKAGGQVRETVPFNCCTFGRSGRAIAGALGGGRAPRTIYQSFLIDFGSQGTDSATDFGLRGHVMWNGGVDDSFRTVGLFVDHFSGTNQLALEVTTQSGHQSQIVGGGMTLEQLAGVHLLVLKFNFNAPDPDAVSVCFDATDSIEANYSPAASIPVADSDLFITHQGAFSQFTFSGPGHIPGALDEVHWGDTFLDVTPFAPVPEPARIGLFGLGLTALLLVRRRAVRPLAPTHREDASLG